MKSYIKSYICVTFLLILLYIYRSYQFLAVLFFIIGSAFASNVFVPATTLYRAPEHDSAIIQSERFGGNFAYSTVEGHAYKAVSPVVQNIVKPVAVSYETKLAPTLTYAPAIPYAYAAHGAYFI